MAGDEARGYGWGSRRAIRQGAAPICVQNETVRSFKGRMQSEISLCVEGPELPS